MYNINPSSKSSRKDSDIICFCQEITLGTIKKAIQNGAHTVEDIGIKTDAGITCGACIEDIEEILEEELKV